MKAFHRTLCVERDSMERQISAVAQALDALGIERPATARGGSTVKASSSGGSSGGSTGGRRRGRPRSVPTGGGGRPGSLKSHIWQVLSRAGGPVTVKDMANGIVKSG